MNIVHVIGNGFDLNLGLKTSYQNFYEYCEKQFPEDDLIREMKKNLDSQTWADLEIALGKYTEVFGSVEDFQSVYFDISDKLFGYIQLEETKLKLSAEKKNKLSRDIANPELHLRSTDKRGVLGYCSRHKNTEWYINIINFNYSTTIERLLDFQARERLVLGKTTYGYQIYLSNIRHIHGTANEGGTIILGVNDPSQIENESFRTDINLSDILVKPQSIRGIRNGVDADCSSLLQKANMICIFGSSIGETDKIWWELLGEQLKRDDCRVIYFVHENGITMKNRLQLLSRKIRESQNHILSKTNLTDTEKDGVRNKIWVGYNTDMFNLIEKMSHDTPK
jgi:uncharacterized protein YeeX (DUF496 family)